jgi:hypothetical protein
MSVGAGFSSCAWELLGQWRCRVMATSAAVILGENIRPNFRKSKWWGLRFCSWAEFFASLALICFGLENICFNRYL